MAIFDPTRYEPPLEALVARLRAVEGAAIIGIDGRMGAGKTALASWLAQQLGWVRYSLDDSIPVGGGQHRRGIALAAIRRLQRSEKPVLVEGARLLKTIHREEINFLIFLADNPPGRPSGRHQVAVEEYLSFIQPSLIADFNIHCL